MACANNFTFCLYGVVLWSLQIGTGCIDIDKRWVKIDNVKIDARWVKFDSGGVKFDNIKIDTWGSNFVKVKIDTRSKWQWMGLTYPTWVRYGMVI